MNQAVNHLPRLCCLLVLVAAVVSPASSVGQEIDRSDTYASGSERESLLLAVKRVMSLVKDVTQRHATDPVAKELKFLSGNMSASTGGGFRSPQESIAIADLTEILFQLRRDVRSLSRDLSARDESDIVLRLDQIEKSIDEALFLARSKKNPSYSENTDWYEPGDGQQNNHSKIDSGNDPVRVYIPVNQNREYSYSEDSPEWKKRSNKWRAYSSSFAGDFTRSWPYAEQAMYREVAGIRYNRVEGFVLGLKRRPLDWSSYERAKIFGQGAYAFSLDKWRYEIGAEAKLGRSHRDRDKGLKFGALYHRNTSTNDLWKSSWTENSLAASLFGYDFFDYYETEGWTAYIVGRLTPYIQFSAGYRRDDYRTLIQNTSWALFGGNSFRLNPEIDEGRMNSVVLSIDGGRVHGYTYRPDGFAFRLQAELGQGMGGDFAYNSFLADIRSYLRLTRDSGFDFRIRGGLARGEVPVQKKFTLGGVGSVRAYPQNIFIGTRMLLANAEYTIYRQGLMDGVFDELSIFGLFDAGWTNKPDLDKFEWDDVFSAAGFGVALDDRMIRLELAWPLKDMGLGTEPTLWLRLNPTF